jgi:hypothetical protein
MMPTGVGYRRLTGLVLPLVWLVAEAWAAAQPAAPPPPKEYKVHLRYRIRANRAQRIAQFLEMTKYLQAIGFNKDPGPDNEAEDNDATRMTGTIPSANARRLLSERHVKSLLLIPAGFEVPADPEAPVKVQLQLSGGLPLDRQQVLADQVRGLLLKLGFREAVGYDNRAHTRLVGTVPAGRLTLLLEDLRQQATGWLVPEVPVTELPLPLRNVWPLVVTEVIPEPDGVTGAKEPPVTPEPGKEPEHLLKITPDVRALASGEGEAARPIRLEVILASAPAPYDRSWQRELISAAPDALVEGRLGLVVTLLARPDQAAALAALPGVTTVRLPRSAAPQALPSGERKAGGPELLRTSLERLHPLGHRGRGLRVAVIDSDFRGYQEHVGKRLLSTTRYIDLTAERRPDLTPEPFAGDPKETGHGTQCALAAALAAPEAELTLVRIDPAAPYQLQSVARALNCDDFYSVGLQQRRDELAADAERQRVLREELLAERRAVLDTFKQDEQAVQRREAYFKRQAEFERAEAELYRRQERYLSLLTALSGLKGVQVVSCALVWNEGYAVDGSDALSRYIDDSPFKSAFWFQAAGNTRGQSWAGLFHDTDGNGVLEFAPFDAPLRPERWTPELNFLAWQPFTGQPAPELPANARIRLSVQWREPHAREFAEGFYRRPLADLRLVVLRQRDPSGAKLPADDLEVVARSEGLPQRLDIQPSSATYEQTVEFTVDAPGRYALRVEGRIPSSIRPPGEPVLAAMQKSWELWPRIFVQTADEPSRATGRAVFLDYATAHGSIGVPGGARRVLTVGAADRAGRLQPYSATGPVHRVGLLPKPEVVAWDELPLGVEGSPAAYGTSLASAFAAGLTASTLSAGTKASWLWQELHAQPARLLPMGRQ